MKTEAQIHQPVPLSMNSWVCGFGVLLTILICILGGTSWQAALTITFVLAYAILISVRLDWGIYAIVLFAVMFIDGWAPTRSPDDVAFRIGIGRLYIMEFAVYGLLLAYLLWGGRRSKDGGRQLLVRTPIDKSLMFFAVLIPVFAMYGLALGNPLKDAAGYFEWRSLFLAIVFYFLVNAIILSRQSALNLFWWFFGLVSLKATYFLFMDLTHSRFFFPGAFGAGALDEGPETVMFCFVALPAISFLLFKFRKNLFTSLFVIATIVILVANLVLSTKRSAQVGLVAGLLFLLWHLPRRQKIKLGLQCACAALAVIVVVKATDVRPNTSSLQQSASRYGEIVSAFREPQDLLIQQGGTLAFHLLDLWDAWNVIKLKPILGYGFGSHYVREYTLLPGVGGEAAGLEPGVVHDQYLHIWWKMGIVGLGVYLWLIFSFFWFGSRVIWRTPASQYRSIALGLYAALLSDATMELWGPQWFTSTKVSLLIFLAMALVFCLSRTEDNNLLPRLQMDALPKAKYF